MTCGCRGRCSGDPRLSMGALTAAQLAAGNYQAALNATGLGQTVDQAKQLTFQAGAIMGDAMNDLSTAQNVVATFTQSGIDYTGDQGKKQVQEVALALQLIPGVGQVLGGAILAITSAVGFAHAGPGVCSTDPPGGYGWGDLKAWPHYVSWAQSGANSAPPGQAWTESTDAPGSFEQYANLALAYNEALADNCYANVAVIPEGLPALLAQLVAAWNASHLGPTRTISRVMPYGSIGSYAKGYDPIANALEWTDPSGALGGKTISFAVNAGPAIATKRVVKLSLPSAASQAADKAAAAAAATQAQQASSARVAVVATGAAVAAGALYVHLRGVASLPRWLRRLV
jgi:hypothetical protein